MKVVRIVIKEQYLLPDKCQAVVERDQTLCAYHIGSNYSAKK